MQRSIVAILFAAGMLCAQQPPLLDSQGRHFFPHGFVTLTGDTVGDLDYTPEDYLRMARLGANFQVIRIFFGKIGAWPGYEADPTYLAQVDRMIQMGKGAGISSVLKLTVYDVKGFSHASWTELWRDKGGRQQRLIDAWRRVFQRFKDEPALLGYDLINEPIRGEIESNEVFVRDYLVPLYRKIIDVLQQVSPGKTAFFQPPLLEPRERWEFPFGRMDVPLERKSIVYVPHYYGTEAGITMERYPREAALSGAPLLMAEHGDPTWPETDTNLERQQAYVRNFVATVAHYDRHALGGVKPWFCGTRVKTKEGATWAVFKSLAHAGGAERKYVLDVVARPKPHVVAGIVRRYGFNFATREFEMVFAPDVSRGESVLFVPLDRHYPDGFRVVYSRGLTVAHDARSPRGLRVIENKTAIDPEAWRWDANLQRLHVPAWDSAPGDATLRIVPGGAE